MSTVIEFGALIAIAREFILLLLSVFWRVIVAEVLELILEVSTHEIRVDFSFAKSMSFCGFLMAAGRVRLLKISR